MDWVDAIRQLRDDGCPGVLITVTDVRGHAPRNPGTKMVVGSSRTWGTVGGGNLEASAIDRARALLDRMAGGERPDPVHWESRLNSHERTDHGRQCCGGVVSLLLEPLPVRPTVAIFGVGHVGYELARILSRLEINLVLVDSRADQLHPLRLADVTDGPADTHVHHNLIGEQVLVRLPAGSHLLIMTHDHAEDYALCDAALRRDDLGSIGLIGSSAKWTRFRTNLLNDGHSADTITRIECPIGLPELTGKEPAVIAVGVAARVLARLPHQRDRISDTPLTGRNQTPNVSH
jgi:xanthine dehydrogenase accessory factor